MNPTFPATSYTESTASVIAATADPIARQYLEYDNWLFNERTRNWSAYQSYTQYQKQQEDLRVRILKLHYERSVAQFYEKLHEQQKQALEAQKAAQEKEQRQQEQRRQREQQQQDEADMESYLKEIEEQHQQQWRELEPEEDDPEEWRKAAEDFAASCRAEELQERRAARREHQRESRRERRAFARADKAFKNILNAEQTPGEGEVSRAENYNADKPSRNVRNVGAGKRKSKKFQARRKFGSGWAKQLE